MINFLKELRKRTAFSQRKINIKPIRQNKESVSKEFNSENEGNCRINEDEGDSYNFNEYVKKIIQKDNSYLENTDQSFSYDRKTISVKKDNLSFKIKDGGATKDPPEKNCDKKDKENCAKITPQNPVTNIKLTPNSTEKQEKSGINYSEKNMGSTFMFRSMLNK